MIASAPNVTWKVSLASHAPFPRRQAIIPA